jgi:hypothetical protein
MLAQINMRQFNDWREYADLEPFDEQRADLRAASIVQAIWNSRGKRPRGTLKLKDCVLPFESDDAVAQSPERARAQVLQVMTMLMEQHNPKKGKK